MATTFQSTLLNLIFSDLHDEASSTGVLDETAKSIQGLCTAHYREVAEDEEDGSLALSALLQSLGPALTHAVGDSVRADGGAGDESKNTSKSKSGGLDEDDEDDDKDDEKDLMLSVDPKDEFKKMIISESQSTPGDSATTAPPSDSDEESSSRKTSPYEQSAAIRTRALLALKSASQILLLPSSPTHRPVPPTKAFASLLSKFLESRVKDAPSAPLCFDVTRVLVSAVLLTPTPEGLSRALTVATKVLASADVNSLPRYVRSSAFDLVLAASGTGLPPGSPPPPAFLGDPVSAFTTEVAQTLMGEKDPRCLLAGLRGLRQCQTILAPLSKYSSTPFPSAEVFDAVSVYYPITFQPPPNDPNGITNSMLRTALNLVLSGESSPSASAAEAIRMIMDRVAGSSTDSHFENVSDSERLDAVLDARHVAENAHGGYRAYESELSNVRLSLIAAHEAVFQGDADPDSGACAAVRDFAEMVARSVSSSGNGEATRRFVDEGVRNVSDAVLDSPESVNGRGSLLFLCALAKGGLGPLRSALGAVAPGLVKICGDRDDLTRAQAAAAGLGMLFAAARRDVVYEPNPVEPFAEAAAKALSELALLDKAVGGVAGMTALLTSTPAAVVPHNVAKTFVSGLLEALLDGGAEEAFKLAASHCVGGIVGSPPYSTLADECVPRLLEQAMEGERYHREALGRACSLSFAVSEGVVPKLSSELSDRIRAGEPSPLPCAEALALLVRVGGENTSLALSGADAAGDLLRSFCAVNSDASLESLRSEEAAKATPAVAEVFKGLDGRARDEAVAYFHPMLKADDVLSRRRATISLPLLDAALRIDPGTGEGADTTDSLLVDILPPLSDLALDLSFPPRARAAAAGSVVSVIRTCGLDGVDLAEGALDTAVLPALRGSKGVEELAGAIRVMAMVGGAAACRGGRSSASADAITSLLAELAVKGEGRGLNPSRFDRAAVRTVAGEGFGEMLSSEGGGAFWRQRCASIALPALAGNIKDIAASREGQTEHRECIGSLIAAGHFACCVPLPLLRKGWGGGGPEEVSLVECIMTGLVLAEKRAGTGEAWEDGAFGTIACTGLAAFVRLTAATAEEGRDRDDGLEPFEAFYPALFPTLLHFAAKVDKGGRVDVNIMALRCLQNLGGGTSAAKLRRYLPSVKHRLSLAFEHPNRAVREAAVKVRNSYFQVERKMEETD